MRCNRLLGVSPISVFDSAWMVIIFLGILGCAARAVPSTMDRTDRYMLVSLFMICSQKKFKSWGMSFVNYLFSLMIGGRLWTF